jgi:type I restriction enzyme S subunit
MSEYKRHYSILKEKIISYSNIDTGEQQKIANCLSSVDELIESQQQKIEGLKAHKKGLLQKLFPTIKN